MTETPRDREPDEQAEQGDTEPQPAVDLEKAADPNQPEAYPGAPVSQTEEEAKEEEKAQKEQEKAEQRKERDRDEEDSA
jgi:hypothetical protein